MKKAIGWETVRLYAGLCGRMWDQLEIYMKEEGFYSEDWVEGSRGWHFGGKREVN